MQIGNGRVCVGLATLVQEFDVCCEEIERGKSDLQFMGLIWMAALTGR